MRVSSIALCLTSGLLACVGGAVMNPRETLHELNRDDDMAVGDREPGDDGDGGESPEDTERRPGDSEPPAGDGDGGVVYSTDPAEFYGAARCPGLVLCEDFEDAPLGGLPNAAIWHPHTTSTPGVTMAVDAARAARGSRALRIIVPPHGAAEAYLQETQSFAVTGNAFYGRLFYYMATPWPAQFFHWNIIEAQGPDVIGGVSLASLYRYGGVSLKDIFNNYLFQFEHHPREPGFTEIGQEEHGQIEPLGAWVCLEWFFDGDATVGRLWRNGVELPALYATSPYNDVSFRMPTFNALNVGWALYQSIDDGQEIWLDSIAIDTQRIGCNR